VNFTKTDLWVEESTMKTTPIPVFQVVSRPSLAARLADFVTLMKPRVMALAVFTALVGMMTAPVRLEPFLGSVAILAIAAGAGAAGVLNMWYDARNALLWTTNNRGAS
jgi:heme O synthase-like polyprenyltransferase